MFFSHAKHIHSIPIDPNSVQHELKSLKSNVSSKLHLNQIGWDSSYIHSEADCSPTVNLWNQTHSVPPKYTGGTGTGQTPPFQQGEIGQKEGGTGPKQAPDLKTENDLCLNALPSGIPGADGKPFIPEPPETHRSPSLLFCKWVANVNSLQKAVSMDWKFKKVFNVHTQDSQDSWKGKQRSFQAWGGDHRSPPTTQLPWTVGGRSATSPQSRAA